MIDGVPDAGTEDVHCPQCSRFLGVRDIAFVLRTELDDLVERLTFEKDRLEKDEAVYGLTDCDPEMKYYGREVSRADRRPALGSEGPAPPARGLPGQERIAVSSQGVVPMTA